MVLLSWCDDPADPHHAVSRDAEARLLAAGDARGGRLRVEPIPMPTPMFLTDAAAAAIRSGLFPTHEIVCCPPAKFCPAAATSIA